MDEDTERTVDDIRALLEARLAQVRAELEALAEADLRAMISGAQMQYGRRIGDHTTDALEHTRKVGMADSLKRLEGEVRAAIDKLSAGTYGYCEDCGKRIARARLEALPWASRCLECQERRDRRGAGHRP